MNWLTAPENAYANGKSKGKEEALDEVRTWAVDELKGIEKLHSDFAYGGRLVMKDLIHHVEEKLEELRK